MQSTMGPKLKKTSRKTDVQRFGAHLRKLRLAKGFESQPALAKALNALGYAEATRFTISRWELGVRWPDYRDLGLLARALSLSSRRELIPPED